MEKIEETTASLREVTDIRAGQVYRVIFTGKWRLPILREIAKHPRRLSELKRAIPDCSKKMLIETLHALETSGFITRHDKSTKTRWVEYSLRAEIAELLGQLLAKM